MNKQYTMRKSAAWMSIWDDRILEVVREKEGSSVGDLHDHQYIRISKSQVSRRCKRLAEHGLLRPLGNGVYMITEKGERYLDEELDAGDLEDDNNGEGTATV